MKKVSAFILVLAMVVTISGCSTTAHDATRQSVEKSISEGVNDLTSEITSDYVQKITNQAVQEVMAAMDFGEMNEFIEATINEAMKEINSDSLQDIISQSIREAMENIDYEEDDRTRNQKIEVWSADGTQLLRTITDYGEIVSYIRNQRIEEWRFFSKLPEDAKVLYRMVSWEESRKNTGELIANSRDTLYQAPTGEYYLRMELDGEAAEAADVDANFVSTSQIPEEAALFLIGVAEGNDIPPFSSR